LVLLGAAGVKLAWFFSGQLHGQLDLEQTTFFASNRRIHIHFKDFFERELCK
jgi:hypothetical protein